MISLLKPLPPDPILKVMGAARKDPRPDKIDLGVGVYCDEKGETPVMQAIKEAEIRLLAVQTSKRYVAPEGDRDYVALTAELAFGAAGAEMVGVQSVGGTGALRVGMDLLRRAGTRRVLLPVPSWPNHPPVIEAAGLERVEARFFDVAAQRVAFDGILEAMANLDPGDAVLLQGSCHNPLGADLTPAQWDALARECAARDLVPFVDIAYQGLGDGLEADVAGVRRLLAHVPQAVFAVSGAKTFGVYRERVGAIFVHCPPSSRAAIASTINAVTRANYSMPPDHGAAAVRIVLGDPGLRELWARELETMRSRLRRTRAALAGLDIPGLPLDAIDAQKGMFSTLPLSLSQIEHLRTEHAVYMTDSGRINIAGFREGDVARFAGALRDAVRHEPERKVVRLRAGAS